MGNYSLLWNFLQNFHKNKIDKGSLLISNVFYKFTIFIYFYLYWKIWLNPTQFKTWILMNPNQAFNPNQSECTRGENNSYWKLGSDLDGLKSWIKSDGIGLSRINFQLICIQRHSKIFRIDSEWFANKFWNNSKYLWFSQIQFQSEKNF